MGGTESKPEPEPPVEDVDVDLPEERIRDIVEKYLKAEPFQKQLGKRLEADVGKHLDPLVARATEVATKAAEEAASRHVTTHMDALVMRVAGSEREAKLHAKALDEIRTRLDRVLEDRGERAVVKGKDGPKPSPAPEPKPEEPPVPAPAAPVPSPAAPPTEDVLAGACKGCGMVFNSEDKAKGYKRCPECGTPISWMP